MCLPYVLGVVITCQFVTWHYGPYRCLHLRGNLSGGLVLRSSDLSGRLGAVVATILAIVKAAMDIIFLACWCRYSSNSDELSESSLLYIQGKKQSSEWQKKKVLIVHMYMALYTCTCLRKVVCCIGHKGKHTSDQSPNKGGVTSDVIFFMPQTCKTCKIQKIFCSWICSTSGNMKSSIVTLQGMLSHMAPIVMWHDSIVHHCKLLW